MQLNNNVFVDELKKFILDNGIIGTAAGVSIALVTKDVIQSLVGDIIIPGICIILINLNFKYLTSCLPGTTQLDITHFIKQFISWIFVIIITFLFIKIAFNNLLGIKSTQPTPTKPITQEIHPSEKSKESFFGENMY